MGWGVGRWEYGGGGCRCALRKGEGRGGGRKGTFFFLSVFFFLGGGFLKKKKNCKSFYNVLYLLIICEKYYLKTVCKNGDIL